MHIENTNLKTSTESIIDLNNNVIYLKTYVNFSGSDVIYRRENLMIHVYNT